MAQSGIKHIPLCVRSPDGRTGLLPDDGDGRTNPLAPLHTCTILYIFGYEKRNTCHVCHTMGNPVYVDINRVAFGFNFQRVIWLSGYFDHSQFHDTEDSIVFGATAIKTTT